MRRVALNIIAVLCACISCAPDFDELNDTDQRYITFTFDADSLYSTVIDSNGTCFGNKIPEFSSDHRIRITSYCYDLEDSLLFHDMLVVSHLESQSIKIRHLYKDESYRFVFLADIVKYDQHVSFYETWFQLGTKNWSDFYIYADNRDDDALKNVIGLCSFVDKPENQVVNVDFLPITYNGYYVFDDLDMVDRLEGYVAYCSSFNLKSLEWDRIASLAYEFDYYNEKKKRIVKPVSLSFADSLINAQIRRTTLHTNDTLDIKINNRERRPFIVTVNCDEFVVTDCKFF